MADEVFALSPISARASLPSEQDYDAIREAFMETSRGRWFLGEYAKRNRNADTTMVLDAVARIEETLAEQRKPLRDPLFDEALACLHSALSEAREAAKAALDDLAIEENLAPVRKGARVIREIAWRLREIGADGRICDLIDSQVSAIEAAAGKLAAADLAGALDEVFDRIAGKIAEFDAGAAASPPPPAEACSPDPSDMAPAAPQMEATVEAQRSEPAEDGFDANDEALLDMVALEMGAPDSDAAYDPNLDEFQIPEHPVREVQVDKAEPDRPRAGIIDQSAASYEIDVSFPDSGDADELVEAGAAPAATPPQAAPQSARKAELPERKAEPGPVPEPSLGSSLLANGIVPRTRASKPDPLAPIRRMSQTEKIAFFS